MALPSWDAATGWCCCPRKWPLDGTAVPGDSWGFPHMWIGKCDLTHSPWVVSLLTALVTLDVNCGQFLKTPRGEGPAPYCKSWTERQASPRPGTANIRPTPIPGCWPAERQFLPLWSGDNPNTCRLEWLEDKREGGCAQRSVGSGRWKFPVKAGFILKASVPPSGCSLVAQLTSGLRDWRGGWGQ